MRWAADYGIPIVNTAVGGHQSADENEAAFLANIGAMADEAEKAGIAIGLEIHGDIMASGAVTLPLLEKIGRDSVGINYDTANVVYYSGDTAVEDLPKVVDKLVHVHLKESKGGKGVWDFGEIGTGDVDFARRPRDPPRRGVRRAVLGRDRVQRRAVAAAPRGERRDARLAGGTEQARPGMKRYMPEMTNLQVREYLEGGGRTVLVPVGSTEDHGDHGPLWTDVYIPLEVCKRAAEELDALVGPPVPFGLAPDHRGASGIIYVRLATFVSMLRDICVSLAEAGFERIALVNGHYVNTTAMQYAAAEMFDDLPRGVRVYPFAVLAGAPAGAGRGVPVGKRGPARERRRDLRRAGDRPRPLRHGARARLRAGARRVHEPPAGAARPGLPVDARLVLGAARGGRRCLGQSERVDGREGRAVPRSGGPTSVVNLVRDMETMHDRIAPGYDRFRQPRA